MKENIIRKKLIQILIDSGIYNGSIEEFEDEIFSEIIGEIDSLEILNLVVEIENKFAIELPDEFMNPENFSSMEYLCDCINQLKRE